MLQSVGKENNFHQIWESSKGNIQVINAIINTQIVPENLLEKVV